MYEEAFKKIDDIFWKDAGCSSELDYIEQTSWILFLKYLDDYENDKETAAILNGKPHKKIIDKEFRWEQWAYPKTSKGKLNIDIALTGDDLLDFVNKELFLILQDLNKVRIIHALLTTKLAKYFLS